MNTAKFYAIRIVGTDYFKRNKHPDFGSYEIAMAAGVFFNKLENAEKAVRDAHRSLSHYSTYTILDGTQTHTYYVDAQHPALKNDPELFRPIELEIVELELRIV